MVTLKIASQVVAAGQPGPIGKSAYQSAVDNGFVGTEQEWLNSLLPFKGWFDSEESLKAKYPEDSSLENHPIVGDYAYVYDGSEKTYIYKCNEDAKWEDSGITVDTSEVQTFTTGEAVNEIGISTNFDDDKDDDEQLITRGGVRRLLKVTSCDSLGIASTKVIESEFSPVEGVGFKVVMAHRNTLSGTEILMSMNGVVAPVLFEGAEVTTSNTWGDGETIDVFYDGENFIAKRIIGKFKTGENVSSVGIDTTPTSGSENLLTSGGAKTSFDSADEKIDNLEEEKANKDGYYSQMTVGSAENLVGQTVDKDAYLIRPTATSDDATNEVANGVASVLGMEGNSAVWNQLIQNGDFSDTTDTLDGKLCARSINNNVLTLNKNATAQNFGQMVYKIVPFYTTHKYYASAMVRLPLGTTETRVSLGFRASNGVPGGNTIIGYIETLSNDFTRLKGIAQPANATDRMSVFCASSSPVGATVNVKNFFVVDLTLLGIDNLTTTAQVEAWLAKHVGTKPYYAYNTGTILSSQTLGIKTYGQNLLNPTTRQARLIPYDWEDNSNVYTIKNVPSADDLQITYTPDATGVAVTIDTTESIPDSIDVSDYGGSGVLYISSATADTYVCMKWDGKKDDEVVPYEEHTYDFDVRKVYGKVNGEGSYVQCFPDGMKSAGSVHDILTASKAVVKIGSVDLGTLTWKYRGYDVASKPLFDTASIIDMKSVSNSTLANLLSTSYVASTYNKIIDYYTNIDKNIGIRTNGWLMVVNKSYTDATTFKTAMSGVPLYYELATPITYTDLIYRDNGIDSPLADVLMNIEVNNWSMEEQLMTPYEDGNPTSIPATISTIYGMNAVEQIDTLNKTCYFAQDVKDNLQALLNCINTNCAETLGGTFSIGDPTQEDSKVFTFTFTENTEPDVEPTNEGE